MGQMEDAAQRRGTAGVSGARAPVAGPSLGGPCPHSASDPPGRSARPRRPPGSQHLSLMCWILCSGRCRCWLCRLCR